MVGAVFEPPVTAVEEYELMIRCIAELGQACFLHFTRRQGDKDGRTG